MIAPKRAVMIDNLARRINDLPDASPENEAHPSQAPRAHPGQRTLTDCLSADRPAHESVPVTCSTCRLTYLPSAAPAASRPGEDWVCEACQQRLG